MALLFSEMSKIEEDKKRAQAAAKKRRAEAKNRGSESFGTGSMLMRKPSKAPSVEDLTRLPGDSSKETKAIDSIITDRSDFPISRKAATQQFNQEQAELGKFLADKRRSEVSPQARETAKKKSEGSSKTNAALALASQAGGGVGNIASGALSGASFGPPGMIAGAALGAVKNLAARKRKTQQLQAQAILGQGDAAVKASEGEREALKNIIEGLRSAMIF